MPIFPEPENKSRTILSSGIPPRILNIDSLTLSVVGRVTKPLGAFIWCHFAFPVIILKAIPP